MNYIAVIARITIIEAYRSRMLAIGLAIAVAGFGAALFLGEIAITEVAQVQSTIIAAFVRLGAVFLLIAFVVSSMVREFHDQTVAFTLSQPMSRHTYVLGKLAGFFIAAAVLAVFASAPLIAFAPIERVLWWGGSLVLELLIVATASLFCVVTLTNFVAAFAAVGAFYVLARSMDAIQIIAGSFGDSQSLADQAMTGFVSLLAFLLPHIDQMTRASWLADPTAGIGELLPALIQAPIYVALLLGATLFDFHRQNL
jgi:Cu-processing system permease protein